MASINNVYPSVPAYAVNNNNATDVDVGSLATVQAFGHPGSDTQNVLTNMASLPGRTVTDAISRARIGVGYSNAKIAKANAVAAGNSSDIFSATVKKDTFGAIYGVRKVLAPVTGLVDTVSMGIFGAPALGFLAGATQAGYTAGNFLGNGADGTVARSLHYASGTTPANSPMSRVDHPNRAASSAPATAGETGATLLGGAALFPVLVSTSVGTVVSAVPKLLITGVAGVLGGAYGLAHGAVSTLKNGATTTTTTPAPVPQNDAKAAPVQAAPAKTAPLSIPQP